jgi:hypothetical protein
MTTTIDLNHLRLGSTYDAVTSRGLARGEYLGIETSHGEWAILLRNAGGTTSIGVADLSAVTPAV